MEKFPAMDVLLHTLTAQRDEMLAMLREFVECETPSNDKAALDLFAGKIAAIARDLGAQVRILPQRTNGNHLLAEFLSPGRRKGGRILLLGHMDTVWEQGTLARMPFRLRNGRAYGPGVFDMKAGIVMALSAIRSLRQLGIPVKENIALLLNSDEEIGSPSSRPITEREARRSDTVLVIEPPHGIHGALKTARKGVGDFLLRVRGRAAHAGIEPEKGASAILELSRQLLILNKLARPIKGATISAGVIRGGTRSNVIPAEAEACIDVRVVRAQDQHRIEKRLRALRPIDPRTKLTVSGGFNRPPMERTPATVALYERARHLAKPLGIALRETAVGGGSDGNFTAALGVPTLDGLGAVGDGAHAAHEHIILRELPRRTALLAHLIASLAAE
jgi:glutamate carboxypeptidase